VLPGYLRSAFIKRLGPAHKAGHTIFDHPAPSEEEKMTASILHPELLTIIDEKSNQSYFGGDQEWYASEWHRRAGCGPTSASNLLAYLAFTRPELRALYGYDNMSHENFSRHMEDVYKFVTPGNMGLNRTEMYTEGVAALANSRGITLSPHVLDIPGNMAKARPPFSQVISFIQEGLASDCPMGFLNLTRGKVRNLQGWHWITLVAADMDENKLIASVSDEGKQISIDLRLWYLTTRMHGGLVYFT
jgi:hypothetical protein